MINQKPCLSNNIDPSSSGADSRWIHEVACADCCVCTLRNRVLPMHLEEFTSEVLVKMGVNESEANTVARVLVAADVRGIPSHGVARLPRYMNGLVKGTIIAGTEMTIAEPSPAIGMVDANNGLGQVAGELGMNLAITKAKDNGIGMVTVKNSNHYGIAGYYALMAIEQGMLGISLTNSAPLVVPTNGVELMLGTNPISVGAPAQKHPHFLLDMATSVVPRGKLEVYDRNLKQMPAGWTIDEAGYDCQNPGQVLKNLINRVGGGILPLGGRGEQFSGHKGYGLAFLVDILSGVLSGAAYGPGVDNVHGASQAGKKAFPNVGHSFIAIDISRFMPLEQFESRLDDMIATIIGSKKAIDQETIFIHGQKEHAKTEVHRETGIPIAQNVFDTLARISGELGIQPPTVQDMTPACRS